jgi:hypothetical protein
MSHLSCYPKTKTNIFVMRATSTVSGCLAVRHARWVNFSESSLRSSFRHGGLEPRFTWMSSDASLRTWMPAVHAGMTMRCRDRRLNLSFAHCSKAKIFFYSVFMFVTVQPRLVASSHALSNRPIGDL